MFFLSKKPQIYKQMFCKKRSQFINKAFLFFFFFSLKYLPSPTQLEILLNFLIKPIRIYLNILRYHRLTLPRTPCHKISAISSKIKFRKQYMVKDKENKEMKKTKETRK